MKTLLITAAALLAATSASAFRLSPAPVATTFTTTSTYAMPGQTITCYPQWAVQVNANGKARVKSVIERSNDPTCRAIEYTGLPWPMKAYAAHDAVTVVEFTSPTLGSCGPVPIDLAVGVRWKGQSYPEKACQVTLVLKPQTQLAIVR